MAFSVWFQSHLVEYEKCDKCKKPATKEHPLLFIDYRERTRESRTTIQVHEDCLLKAIHKEKQKQRDQEWEEMKKQKP